MKIERRAMLGINSKLLVTGFLVLSTCFVLTGFGRTIRMRRIDSDLGFAGYTTDDFQSDLTYGVDFSKGWYNQYKTREKVSDPSGLSMPSQTRVDAWKKKYLIIPYPPKYKVKPSSSNERNVSSGLNHHYWMLHDCDSLLEEAYVEYIRYGLDIKPINEVCNDMRRVSQINAWKKVWEHSTKVRDAANETLRKEIGSVRCSTDYLFKVLVEIKDKEYADWASKHPQQAMNITVKKRLQAAERKVQIAERAARNAEARATAAESAAASAAADAEDARREAAEAGAAAWAAERRARNAENR